MSIVFYTNFLYLNWFITAKKRAAEASRGLVSTTVILWSLTTVLNAKRTQSFKLSLSDHWSQTGEGILNNKWGRKKWNTFERDNDLGKLLMRTIPLLQVGVQLKVHSGAQTNLLNLNWCKNFMVRDPFNRIKQAESFNERKSLIPRPPGKHHIKLSLHALYNRGIHTTRHLDK